MLERQAVQQMRARVRFAIEELDNDLELDELNYLAAVDDALSAVLVDPTFFGEAPAPIENGLRPALMRRIRPLLAGVRA